MAADRRRRGVWRRGGGIKAVAAGRRKGLSNPRLPSRAGRAPGEFAKRGSWAAGSAWEPPGRGEAGPGGALAAPRRRGQKPLAWSGV